MQADEQAGQLSHIHWPEAFPLPDSLVAARIQVQNQQLEKTRAENSRQEKLAAIEKHLAHLETAISEGHIKAASRALTALNHLNEKVAAPKKSLNRIHELTTKLSELRDWQGYATDPKREELCNSMERLATDPGILPTEKAKAIKELQTQWKKLGSSDSRSAQRMWARFKKQGDLAYEPCAQYFAEQRNVREKNLAEKKKICDFLEVFIQENDWEHTDWKKANAVIKKAKNEWRKYDDIPGSKRKKIYGRFSGIIDALQAKQNTEYQRNHNLKSGLIADIKEIVTADMPVKQKVDKTKAVQVQWKTIGITDRRDDQKLWKEFRVECDRIFSEREQRVEAEKQKNNEFLAQVKNTVSAFADFLESNEPIHQSDIHKFKKSLEEFSLSSDHTSIRESQRLIKKASGLIKQQARASSQQMMTELIRRAELCSQYEAGSIDTAALDAAWQGDVELDKPLLEKITARRQGTIGNDPKEAEQLCIRLEILLGIDSPSESATARMAYQVERLNRELSQGIKETRTTAEQIRDIQITWHCLPVKIVDEKLKIRFNQAEAKLGAG